MTVETQSPLPCPAGPVTDLLDAIEMVGRDFDLAGPDGDPRTCAALLRAAAAVEGLALRQVAAVEAFGTCTDVGKASTADLVQAATGCTVAAARSTVRLAERLDGDLRPLGDLLVTGRLSRQHCQAVVHGVRGLGRQVIADSIEAISALALLTDPDTLATELRTRAEAISPELAAEARRRLEARIGLSLEQTPDGTGHLRGTLHPEVLALFQTVTDALVHSDRVQGDTRSAPRRRHDALLAVLRHAADCPGQALPTQGGNRAQVTIIATAATLTGLTGAQPASLVGTGHGLLTQPEFRRLLCDADISTIWLNPTTERLELSRSTPTVNRHQFRVLTTRDRHCVVTGCHRRPTQCQAHHVVHWANGGPSDVDNLVLLCHAHHHDIHDRQRWLPCTNNRVMTPAGWLDPTTASTTDRDPPR